MGRYSLSFIPQTALGCNVLYDISITYLRLSLLIKGNLICTVGLYVFAYFPLSALQCNVDLLCRIDVSLIHNHRNCLH